MLYRSCDAVYGVSSSFQSIRVEAKTNHLIIAHAYSAREGNFLSTSDI